MHIKTYLPTYLKFEPTIGTTQFELVVLPFHEPDTISFKIKWSVLTLKKIKLIVLFIPLPPIIRFVLHWATLICCVIICWYWTFYTTIFAVPCWIGELKMYKAEVLSCFAIKPWKKWGWCAEQALDDLGNLRYSCSSNFIFFSIKVSDTSWGRAGPCSAQAWIGLYFDFL